MKTYDNLPRFTAEVSLSRSLNIRVSLAYGAYYNNTNDNTNMLVPVIATPRCIIKPGFCENTCNDPNPENRANCCWRTDLQDCVCTTCPSPPRNCCGKPLGSSCP